MKSPEIPLKPSVCPALFECAGARVQQILLRDGFEAVVKRGWRKDTLRVGLPRLQVLTAEEFREGTGEVAIKVWGRFLEERLWPAVYAHADELPSPDPVDPFEMLPEMLAKASEDCRHELLRLALAENPGLEPRIPEPPERSAAEELLGKAFPGLKARLAEMWRFEIAGWWNERYQYATAARKRLAQLEDEGGETWERAQLTEELEGAEAALPFYRSLVEQDLDDAPASFALGRALLARGDEAGLVHLDRAMEIVPEAAEPAGEHAFRFLIRTGREAEAEHYARSISASSALGLNPVRMRPSTSITGMLRAPVLERSSAATAGSSTLRISKATPLSFR